MTRNVTDHVPWRGKPWWWFVGTAILLSSALLSLFIASRRDDAWIGDVVSHHCHQPPPLPDTRMLGWITVSLAGAAVLSLSIGLVVMLTSHHRWWAKLGALALLAVSFLVTLWILLMGYLHTEAPGPPGQGIDGSGMPCHG